MDFKRTMEQRVTVKDKALFEFEFSKADLKKAEKATHEKPHLCHSKDDGLIWFVLYHDTKDKLTMKMLHSYDRFEEV